MPIVNDNVSIFKQFDFYDGRNLSMQWFHVELDVMNPKVLLIVHSERDNKITAQYNAKMFGA